MSNKGTGKSTAAKPIASSTAGPDSSNIAASAQNSGNITLTEEQFRGLLATMTTYKTGNFANCSARFDGSRNRNKVEEFISTATIYKNCENIDDENALRGLPLLLTDIANTWWRGVQHEFNSWDDAMSSLRKTFSPGRPAYVIYRELFETKQGYNMSTDLFICEKRALITEIPGEPLSEQQQIDLIFGLLHTRIRQRLNRENILTFNELLQQTRLIEETIKEQCEINVNDRSDKKENRMKRKKCEYCNNFGHSIDECRKKQKAEKDNAENSNTSFKTLITCYGCGQPGVVRSQCRNCNKTKQPANLDFCSINASAANMALPIRSRPLVQIQVHGNRGTAYFDTGARMSVASKSLADTLRKLGYNFSSQQAYITLADGVQQLQTIQVIKVVVKIEYKAIATTFMVFKNSSDNRTLLGVDFIEDAQIVLDLPQQTWHFSEAPRKRYTFLKEEITKKSTINMATLSPTTHSTTPPYDEALCYGPPLPETPPELKTGYYIPEPISPLRDAPKRQALKPISFNFITPRNYVEEDIEEIFKDCLPKESTVSEAKLHRNAFFHVHLGALDVRLQEHESGHLTKHEVTCLNQMLQHNSDIFEPSLEPASHVEHRIITQDVAPIASPPYRLTEQKRNVLKNEIQTMLSKNIIEESESAWASPVVMVPKKDGGIRICIDYRQLNAVTIPDMYPLPRIDDLLHSAKRALYMSSIDLLAGYWQIKMNDEDKAKTAFITPFGIYQFKRMPFGLRNAPATFQRLIDRLKTKLPSVRLLAYLDDLLCLSDSFEQHLDDLRQLFEALRIFNLHANRQKCKFCRNEIKYLGHVLTKEGISMDPEKISAITSRPPPKNLKQLISFLQMCSWYRRFISNYADVAQPLTNLTKKKAAWKWDLDQQKSFEDLKKHLSSAPILRQAEEGKPFTIRADASSYAIGAALLQGEGKDERPVEYCSRLLTSAERNYSTTEREALAVVWAVAKFRGYIEGSEVNIATDHQPLRWLMSLKSPTGRLARWALQLQPYNIKISYTPGRVNVLADTLSRPPYDDEETVATCVIAIDLPHRTVREVREQQLKDEEIEKIIKCLEGDSPKEEASRWTSRGYIISDGVLYRYVPDEETEEPQLVIPMQERDAILKAYHSEPTAGHYGIERTLQRITPKYYWPGIRQYVTKYVKTCPECQRYKISNLKPSGLYQTPVTSQRFEIISIDLFGPLPKTNDGYRWVFVIEDVATGWVELFALKDADAVTCATKLIEQVFFRYGFCRRLISDNGTQFVSAVMQHVTHYFGIQQQLTPVYHPQANPVERKNRDLKTQLSILVKKDHSTWKKRLPVIRFAMNTAYCQQRGYTAAYLTFGRELRAPSDVTNDLRNIDISDNFIPNITPYLTGITKMLKQAREILEKEQDRQLTYSDKKRRPCPGFQPGDYVWVTTHPRSKTSQRHTSKLAPRRDGPYLILHKKGATTYEVADPEKPTEVLAAYHSSMLTKVTNPIQDNARTQPIEPLRKRGRPKKTISISK